MRGSLLALCLVVACATSSVAQPPLIEYTFDQGGTPPSVINLGTLGGLDPLVGHDLTGTSLNGTACLKGSGVAGSQVTSGYAVALGGGDWTVGFCLNTAANGAAFQYPFGEGSGPPSPWRIFVSGASGTGNIMMRGATWGLPDCIIPGGGGMNGWVHVAWVHDSVAGEIRGYLNGTLAVTCPTGPLSLVSGQNILVGNHTTTLQAGSLMEDFRLYDRALADAEVFAWACGCLNFEWDTNDMFSHLTVNGGSNNPLSGPITALVPVGTAATVDINGSVGNPFDILFTVGSPPVSGSGGGILFGPPCPPTILNLNALSPTFGSLNNLLFNNALVPTQIPAFFGAPVSLQAQLVVVDPGAAAGFALSAANDINAVVLPCITVEAVGSNSFNSNTSSGYWRVIQRGNCPSWIESVIFDFAQAAAGTPAALQEFDTDQTGLADRFDGGNSLMLGCMGTYRNGSDAATGLVYDALNTPSPCDPTANTGWIGSVPGNAANDWRTLQFRFTAGMFVGQTFEFDCDTDPNSAGAGSSGGAMAGTVITVIVNDGTGPQTLTGTLAADPNDPNRSFVDFL